MTTRATTTEAVAATSPAMARAGRPEPGRPAQLLAELFEGHAPLVLGICRGMLRDPDEAEDAAQQAFLSAYASLLGGTVPREPAAWLATIARNECRSRVQRRMREPLPELGPDAEGSDPALRAAQAAEVNSLRLALTQLPRRQRRAFLLRCSARPSGSRPCRSTTTSPTRTMSSAASSTSFWLKLSLRRRPVTGTPRSVKARSPSTQLRRHAWACPLLMEPGRVRPARLRYMDLLLGRLRKAGFSAETTYHAYHVLDGHIFGFSLWEASHDCTPEEVSSFVAKFAETITPEGYPYLHEHGEQHFSEGPHREVSAFEVGLDLIVAGLRKLHDEAQRGAPRRRQRSARPRARPRRGERG